MLTITIRGPWYSEIQKVKTPDYCMPFVGYREWKIGPNATLEPLYIENSRAWLPRLIAVSHDDPSKVVRYGGEFDYSPFGFHALKHAFSAFDLCVIDNEICKNNQCWGEVWLWGTVVEHTLGYRASRAYPKRLITTKKRRAQDSEIAARYGIPIITRTSYLRERRRIVRKEKWNATWRTVARVYHRAVAATSADTSVARKERNVYWRTVARVYRRAVAATRAIRGSGVTARPTAGPDAST